MVQQPPCNSQYGTHPRDIYICHFGTNTNIAGAIATQLENDYGWTCWYAERNLAPDTTNDIAVISKMVEKCTVFLLLSSDKPDYCQSTQVAISQALVHDKERIELKSVTEAIHASDRVIDVLSMLLGTRLVKRGMSYKDADYADDGINLAGKIGANMLTFFVVAVFLLGGLIVARAVEFNRIIQASYQDIALDAPAATNIASLPPTPTPSPLGLVDIVTPSQTSEFILASSFAAHGDIGAMYNLAHMYFQMQDMTQAAYWFEKAASNLHLDAIIAIGHLNWDGGRNYDFAGDRVEGFLWFFKAAELGHMDMQNWIGSIYEHGAVISGFYRGSDNPLISQHFHIEFTENNHFIGDEMVTVDFRVLEILPDLERAAYWYRQSAMQGNASAQTSLGVMYIFGYGVDADYYQAVYWYQLAAMQGNSIAQGNLAISYILGEGILQCYDQAMHWFRMSAMQNNSHSQINLAWMYENGLTAEPNLEQSYYWNHRAAVQGNVIGKTNLGLLYMNGYGVEQCYNQAEYWLMQAAIRRYERALYNLMLLYERAIPTE